MIPVHGSSKTHNNNRKLIPFYDSQFMSMRRKRDETERYGISFSRHTDSSLIYSLLFLYVCCWYFVFCIFDSFSLWPSVGDQINADTHTQISSRFFFYFILFILCSSFSFNIELYFVVAEAAFICWMVGHGFYIINICGDKNVYGNEIIFCAN